MTVAVELCLAVCVGWVGAGGKGVWYGGHIGTQKHKRSW